MLEGWGRFVYRRRWHVLLASAALLVLSGFLAARGGELDNPDALASSESGRASALLNGERPSPTPAPANATPVPGTTFVLVFEHDTMVATDPVYQSAVLDAIAPLRSDERVLSVRTYYDAPQQSAALLSRDGHGTLVQVTLRDLRNAADRYWEQLRSEVRSDTLRVYATGNLPINHELNKTLNADLQRAEYFSLPVALVLLLLVFGTVVAALIPVGVGVLAIVGGIGGVFLLSRFTAVSPYALNIVTLVGLAAAIDYSLFIVARFREELARGLPVPDALARAMGTAGRAVMFSGLTVAISLSGMLFFEGTFLATLGVAGSIVLALAVVYGLTFLPALLAILGTRVNSVRVPFPRARRAGPGFWHALAMAVMRRPLLVLVPTVAFILLAGSPFLEFRLQNADPTTIPPQAESRRGYDLLVSSFPGQEQSTINAVAFFPGGSPDSPEHAQYVASTAASIKALPNVLSVSAARSYGRIAFFSVVSSRPSSTDDARELVKRIRALPDPPDGELLVTGATAFDVDTIDFITSRATRAVPFVVLATYVALFFLLGSVLLPLKAVVMNLLSIAASFGALVFVFEQGHLADVLNFTPQSVDPSVPVILFCIVFGLSMDYEVMLLSRIQEEYERTGDNTGAVAEGLERIGRLITAAALIMVAVFVGFALADIVIVKSIGVGMAIAVALDATIVRALIVPATMRLLGRANWWAPAFLLRAQHRLLPLRHRSM